MVGMGWGRIAFADWDRESKYFTFWALGFHRGHRKKALERETAG